MALNSVWRMNICILCSRNVNNIILHCMLSSSFFFDWERQKCKCLFFEHLSEYSLRRQFPACTSCDLLCLIQLLLLVFFVDFSFDLTMEWFRKDCELSLVVFTKKVVKPTSGPLVYRFERQTERNDICSSQKHWVLDLECRIGTFR